MTIALHRVAFCVYTGEMSGRSYRIHVLGFLFCALFSLYVLIQNNRICVLVVVPAHAIHSLEDASYPYSTVTGHAANVYFHVKTRTHMYNSRFKQGKNRCAFPG
jgi:uncharacterized membrane protein required for colicin V production